MMCAVEFEERHTGGTRHEVGCHLFFLCAAAWWCSGARQVRRRRAATQRRLFEEVKNIRTLPDQKAQNE